MSISIRFYHNAGDVDDSETLVDEIDPNSTTCEQLIRKFCSKSRTPFTTETDKIAFLYNGKALNSPRFLNTFLSSSEINLTKTDKKIIIKDMAHLLGQNH